MSKIDKADFDKLFDDTITKKEYDRIIDLIDRRFGEIMLTIFPSLKHRGWFDYGNCSYTIGGVGHFDPENFKDQIKVSGQGYDFSDPYGVDDDGRIPTRWLWEDGFEDEFKAEVEKSKQAKITEKENRKLKIAEKKKKAAEMKKIISAKLTPEELKHVTFK